MKKEYLILTALIVCLSAYLFFRSEGKDHYTLPELEKIEAVKVSKILIEKKGESFSLNRADKSWTVSKDAYPADSSMVDTMLDTLSRFKLTTLVSQKSDLKRYHLDPENRILVIVSHKGQQDFKFTIGKEAPTGNHTFVMIAGDKNIYHASGSFNFDFDQDVESLRDKMVFKVTSGAVKKARVTKEKTAKVVIAKEAKDDKGKVTKIWQTDDGKKVDKQKMDSFLASLSYLKCDTYPQTLSKKDLNDKKPFCTITIDGQETKSLRLFKLKDDDTVHGISTMNEYLFTFSDYDAKQIIENIDKFLGIKKEDQ